MLSCVRTRKIKFLNSDELYSWNEFQFRNCYFYYKLLKIISFHMFRTILIVMLSANVINYRKKLYWTSCICFQGLTLKQVATTKRLFRPDILSRQRSSNLSEIGWIWHLRCSMEEFTLTDGDFQILTVTPRVSKKIMGHNDNSSWIVVMLTSGIDYPSALPAARTLPKLWTSSTLESWLP